MRAASLYSLLVACLCCRGTSFGQQAIGIKLGMGLSMPSVTVMPNRYDTWTPENRNGIVFGIFGQVPLQRRWVFVPAAQFSSKGLRERHTSTTYGYNFSMGSPFSYLDFPLTLIHSSSEKGNGFQLGGGPVASLLLNKNSRSYPVKSFDFGVNGLLSYQTPIGFSVQLNYTFGITDLGENSSHVPDIKNRFLALTVGYLF